ncbi:MAG: polymorphic toxin-type HINT domain-containing protein [Planctomycetota bacterium]
MPKAILLRSVLSHWLVLLSVVATSLSVVAEELRPPGTVGTDESKQQDLAVRSLMGQALQAEVEGNILGRERFLNEAQITQPDYAPHHWYQGSVRGPDASWVSVEEAIELSKKQPLLDEYRAFRATQPASVVGQWNVAIWCAQKGLAAQCRAHLSNILMRDPEHKPARIALGHQLVQGEWMSPQQVQKLLKDAEYAKQAFEQYGESVRRLLDIASNESHVGKTVAKEKLFQIKDPMAVPVFESAARNLGEESILLVVDWLAANEHPSATLGLANLAASSPSDAARAKAMKELKSRSLYDFVPQLLNSMSSPIVFSSVPVFEINGELKGFQQTFAKEEMGEKRIWRFDASLEKFRYAGRVQKGTKRDFLGKSTARPKGAQRMYLDTKYVAYLPSQTDPLRIANEAFAREAAKFTATYRSEARLANAKMENRQIEERNSRIGWVLQTVAGSEFTSLPHDAWNWWDRYNETEYQRDKLVSRRYDRESFVSDARYTPELFAAESKISFCSCFVAGTLVTTAQGLRPIEEIKAGDQVLSRNVQSGELDFMPVVASTKRRPAQTVILQVNDESIHATSSHLLWVSGKGWTKAGDIQSGDLLHGSAEPAVVMKTTRSGVLPTYNLVVDEFHTYFVGKSRVLSHHVQPRKPAHEKVPGEFVFADAK